MVKALEVSIDGKLVGNYVPPAGKTFSAMLANVPKTYMRAQVFSGGPDSETWQWQLPDIEEGQVLAFRMIEAPEDSGVPPHRITKRDPREDEEDKRLAKKAYANAMRERQRDKERDDKNKHK